MFAGNKIREKLLYEIWLNKNFNADILTVTDEKIEIIDVGNNNKDLAGPDFLNARIKIGSVTFKGDVEIDIRHRDWKAHGHYLHKNYNKVILHIVLSKENFQPYVYTQDGRKVNAICLMDFINDDYQSALRKAIISERNNRGFAMPCKEYSNNVALKSKLKFISTLGIERFKNKEKRILDRLKKMIYLKEMNIREPIIRYDFGEEFQNKKFSTEEFNDPLLWQQLIYEMIFEALGYSKNKEMMSKLAKAVNINFLNNFYAEEKFEEIIECSLLNVSGIVSNNNTTPDEKATEYLRKLVEKWSEIKTGYDGPYFHKEKWHFFKLRPQNFPTVRIAGGSRILNRLLKYDLFGNMIAAFTNKEEKKKIISMLRDLLIVKASGFWKTHYVFEKNAKEEIKYFVGLSRADEIIVNVLLPILTVYFDIFNNKDASTEVKSLYLNFIQKSANNVVSQVVESLHLNNSGIQSVYTQGMIELFSNYCVKERCLECNIGKEIFVVNSD